MVSRFYWRGNDVGLDLVNTDVVDGDGAPLDLLADADALLEWAGEAGLVDARALVALRSLPRRQAAGLVDWARRLRACLRALVDPSARPPDDAAAGRFSEVVGEISVRLTLPAEGHPLPVTASGEAERLRLGLAVAAIGTAGLDRSRIRCCEGEGCVLVYYDSSRNGSRRWCDMAACGNRAKSAAHYQRIRRTASN